VIDLRSGFFQLHVHPDDQPKTAVWWRSRLWMMTRVPFGARNAPAYFTRVMQYEISKAGLGHCCLSFIDDLAIHSRTAEEHIEHVAAVLDMLYGCECILRSQSLALQLCLTWAMPCQSLALPHRRPRLRQ
jgi:hypothetical protein